MQAVPLGLRFGVNRVDFGMSAACPVGGKLGNAGCPVLPVEGISLDAKA